MRRRQSPPKPVRSMVKKRSDYQASSTVTPSSKRQRCKDKSLVAYTAGSSSNKKKKKKKKKNANPWLDIPDDVLLRIIWLCTRDPDDVIGLELSCRSLQGAVLRCWKIMAKESYNIVDHDGSGKDAWKEGQAIKSLDTARCEYVYFRNTDFGPFRDDVFFGCNESIMIMSSSGHDTLQDSSGFVPENPIRIRDASTLKIVANMDGSPDHKAVDLLGPSGNEYIVEYLDVGLCAHRNNRRIWEHTWDDGPQPTDQWCMLPSHHALPMEKLFNLNENPFTTDLDMSKIVEAETKVD